MMMLPRRPRACDGAFGSDLNIKYARDGFGKCEALCMLTKVQIKRGVPLTPNWELKEALLYGWASLG